MIEVDLIVIGAGTSGCIIMNKLSKNGRFSVLGIEAGSNMTDDVEITSVGLSADLLVKTSQYKYFWQGFGQTQPMNELNGRVSDWTTGMIAGGESSVNGLYYGRGSNAVYSNWESISGSDNWSINKILGTFNKLENYQGLTITSNSRGTNGAVNVLQTPMLSQLTLNVLLPAVQAAYPGIPIVEDYNDPSVVNCIDPRAQWFIDQLGTSRVSSATAYLNQCTSSNKCKDNRRLKIIYNAVATKISFKKPKQTNTDSQNTKSRRAKYVEYFKNGELVTVKARKAIILAAGINNSKILQLSGIGPESTLRSVGIRSVYVNENVGQHLQNHPTISITLLTDSSDNGVPFGAPYSYLIGNVYLPLVGGLVSDPRMIQILFEYLPGTPAYLVIRLSLLNPVSEGSINIQSNNAFKIASVNEGFYENSTDLENMKSSVKVYIQDLLDQLAIINIAYVPIISDPINQVIISGYDDMVVEEYIKNNTNLSYGNRHYASHCKMQPLNAGGVVNGDTRVYGTKNVYVTGNSICPLIPDINTTASAMMIGLRCSSILKHIL